MLNRISDQSSGPEREDDGACYAHRGAQPIYACPHLDVKYISLPLLYCLFLVAKTCNLQANVHVDALPAWQLQVCWCDGVSIRTTSTNSGLQRGIEWVGDCHNLPIRLCVVSTGV